MITKKEDLIDTYTEKGNQELTKLYLDACEPYIDVHLCRADRFPEDSHFYFNPSVKHIQSGECDTERYKKLTLCDLKPRTRTEYEQATESIWDLRDEFERGELYRLRRDDIDGYVKIRDLKVLFDEFNGLGVFRVVEVEIDERQEFVELCMEIANQEDTQNDEVWLSKMYDAGCRFQE